MTVSVKDIAWLAGFLEGEGTFYLAAAGKKKNGENRRKRPTIIFNSTDKDVAKRCSELMNCCINGPYTRKEEERQNYKPWWQVRLQNTRAIEWMMTLYPFMGDRRKQSIEEVIEYWKQSQLRKRK